MGFAASQARLLLLTARKSDLEFRAQQITNAEMMLAMESEAIAAEYSRKLSNQTIRMIDGGKEVALSYANLSGAGYTVMQYNDGEWKRMTDPSVEATQSYVLNLAALDSALNSGTLSEKEYNEIRTKIGGSKTADEWTATLTIGDNTIDLTQYYNVVENVSNIFTTSGQDLGPQILEGINRGTVYILDVTGKEVSVHNGTGFAVGYYTEDNEMADAEYRRKSSAIQVKEKRLQMDLQQVEAQQKACEAEMESVKKVMEKNIDKSFKVFS